MKLPKVREKLFTKSRKHLSFPDLLSEAEDHERQHHSSPMDEFRNLVSSFRRKLRDHPEVRSDCSCTICTGQERYEALILNEAADIHHLTGQHSNEPFPVMEPSRQGSVSQSITSAMMTASNEYAQPSGTHISLSNTTFTHHNSERAEFLVHFATELLRLNESLDEALHARFSLTKDSEGFDYSLVHWNQTDIGGQNIRGFLRNSFALGENQHALDDTSFSHYKNQLRNAEKRMSLVLDRITLEVGRLVAMRERRALPGNKDAVAKNRIEINTAMMKILVYVQKSVLEQPWTKEHLKRLLCYFDDPKQKDNVKALEIVTTTILGENREVPLANIAGEFDNVALPWQLTLKKYGSGEKTGLEASNSEDNDQEHADENIDCPNCEKSFNLAWLEQNPISKGDKQCPMCNKKLNDDFVTDVLVRLAVNGMIDL